MRFTLQNLGRLREATIDLGKDLIILTGPNNTSKTYVAHTIYGLFLTNFMPLQQEIGRSIVIEDTASGTVEIDLRSSILDRLQEIVDGVCEQYRATLPDVLACSVSFASNSRVGVFLLPDEIASARRRLLEQQYQFELTIHRGVRATLTKHPGVPSISLSLLPAQVVAEETRETIRWHLAMILVSHVRSALFPAEKREPTILVAERAAVQLFSKEISQRRSELIDDLLERPRNMEFLEMRARRYPLPTRIALKMANDLAILRKQESPFAPFADALERDVLGGAIRVSEDGEMSFQPEGMAGSLDMHLSSSSVKALAPLTFYLRHLADKDSLLIIDEPELNLHPDNQRKVARLLGKLARAGIKVMISTHSDYVVREINNLIMLDADKTGELRRKYGYGDDEILSPSQVGAYLFDATSAQPIEVKPTGIEVETIDRVINQLNQVSQDLYFSLFPDEP